MRVMQAEFNAMVLEQVLQPFLCANASAASMHIAAARPCFDCKADATCGFSFVYAGVAGVAAGVRGVL
jgi:hypothetical protein